MTSAQSKRQLSPRKKPGQSRSAATVEAILEAAARILETRGLAGYNTNDIASMAGVSIGSLYQYFPNKDAITGALIRREMEALRAAASIATNQGTSEHRLVRLIEVAVDQQLRRPMLSRLLDIEEERLPTGDDVDDVRSRLAEIVGNCLEDLPFTTTRGDGAIQVRIPMMPPVYSEMIPPTVPG